MLNGETFFLLEIESNSLNWFMYTGFFIDIKLNDCVKETVVHSN